MTGREEIRASQIVKANPITAHKEINEPIEDKTFHGVQASGLSE